MSRREQLEQLHNRVLTVQQSLGVSQQQAAGLRTRENNLLGTLRLVRQEAVAAAGRADAQAEQQLLIEGSLAILRKIAEYCAEGAEKKVAELITEALRESFPDQTLTFRADHEVYRGQSATRLILRDEAKGHEDDPTEGFGGGCRCLIGIILQVIAILRQPGMARLLILDEPTSMVSDDYASLVAGSLHRFCQGIAVEGSPGSGNGGNGGNGGSGLGFDMLVVTHHTALAQAADTHYAASLDADGWLTLTLVKQRT